MPDRKAFELHIIFVGLCMFVDDKENPKGERLHVLLPKTEGHHEHQAALLFNPGYKTGVKEPSGPPLDAAVCRLKNRQLDLTSLNTMGGLSRNFKKSNVFDLGDWAGRTVERRLLDEGGDATPPNESVTRITLDAGTIRRRKKGSVWEIRKPGSLHQKFRGHMAISARWVIDVAESDPPQDFVEFDLKPLNDQETGVETIRLFPIDGKIEVYVYHSPELPKAVPVDPVDPEHEVGDPAPHFRAFYDLLSEPVPVLANLDLGNKPSHETDPEPGVDSQVVEDVPTQGSPSGDDAVTEVAGARAARGTADHNGAGDSSHGGGHGATGAHAAKALLGDEIACIMVTAKAANP